MLESNQLFFSVVGRKTYHLFGYVDDFASYERVKFKDFITTHNFERRCSNLLKY